MSTNDMSDTVAAYIQLRDERESAKKAWERIDTAFDEKMAAYEEVLRHHCLDASLSSFRVETNVGKFTVLLQKKTRYSTTDWEAFHKFVDLHKAYHLFERRIAQANMQTFLEDHPGQSPSGLQLEQTAKAIVRAS